MNPDIYCIHLHLGSTYLALGEVDNAILHFQKQVQLNPTDRFGLKATAALEKIETNCSDEADI